MTFEQLGLCPPILAALKEEGYVKPSPIQEKAIPPALEGRDVLGCAQTGTGKTCAFAAPILQRLEARPAAGRPIRALILTPTRELAIQIDDSFAAYGRHMKQRHAVVFGGVGQNPQVEALKRGVDVLVATPGRLMDLYQQGFVDLSKLEIFVLDEADRMLDMGFIHDVRKILNWLPAKKQTMLFSATMPAEITALVNSLLHDPARVAVDPVSSPVEAIRQSVYFVDKANKTRLLAHLVEKLGVKNALVFTRTKHGANKVSRELEKLGISAAAIHGNKSQTARQQALSDFKAGNLRCLVATDIAARGLDIEELSHVFNYNLPEVPETYVHRIGRTGRAGRGGEAVALCDFGEKPLLKEIEKLLHRSVPVADGHPYPMQVFEAPKRDKNGKLINEEDAEARQAARELRRARDEAKQAKPAKPAEAKPSRQVKPVEAKQPRPAPKQDRPAAPKQKAQPPKPAAPVQREQPRPRPAQGVRSGSVAQTGDAMPNTEFYRPNPLDSDVIMDATARLLASRRTLTPTPAHDGTHGRRKHKRPAEGRVQEAPRAAVREERKPAPVRQSVPKQERAKVPVQERAKVPAPAQEKAKAPAPAQGKAKSSNEPRRRSGDRGGRRAAPESVSQDHTKDSTEQNSLMKPYYLDIGR